MIQLAYGMLVDNIKRLLKSPGQLALLGLFIFVSVINVTGHQNNPIWAVYPVLWEENIFAPNCSKMLYLVPGSEKDRKRYRLCYGYLLALMNLGVIVIIQLCDLVCQPDRTVADVLEIVLWGMATINCVCIYWSLPCAYIKENRWRAYTISAVGIIAVVVDAVYIMIGNNYRFQMFFVILILLYMECSRYYMVRHIQFEGYDKDSCKTERERKKNEYRYSES